MTSLSDLTEREREIVGYIARGWSYAAIAAALPNLRSFTKERIVARTVAIHVAAIARKLPADVEGSTPYRRIQRWALEHERDVA